METIYDRKDESESPLHRGFHSLVWPGLLDPPILGQAWPSGQAVVIAGLPWPSYLKDSFICSVIDHKVLRDDFGDPQIAKGLRGALYRHGRHPPKTWGWFRRARSLCRHSRSCRSLPSTHLQPSLFHLEDEANEPAGS
jgi:hypothetical protein